MKPEVAALILAAGQSRRMGKFKPLLPFGPKTVIESCIENLRDASVREIIIVVGHRADEVRKHLNSNDVEFALNDDPHSEMGASIAHGIERLSNDARAVMISLVDQPAVDSVTIKQIIEAWKVGAALVQPQHKGRGGHPVLIDLKFKDALLNLDPQTGLRGFFDEHRGEILQLTVESSFVARDMDTWEDYLRLHQDVFGYSPHRDLP